MILNSHYMESIALTGIYAGLTAAACKELQSRHMTGINAGCSFLINQIAVDYLIPQTEYLGLNKHHRRAVNDSLEFFTIASLSFANAVLDHYSQEKHSWKTTAVNTTIMVSIYYGTKLLPIGIDKLFNFLSNEKPQKEQDTQ